MHSCASFAPALLRVDCIIHAARQSAYEIRSMLREIDELVDEYHVKIADSDYSDDGNVSEVLENVSTVPSNSSHQSEGRLDTDLEDSAGEFSDVDVDEDDVLPIIAYERKAVDDESIVTESTPVPEALTTPVASSCERMQGAPLQPAVMDSAIGYTVDSFLAEIISDLNCDPIENGETPINVVDTAEAPFSDVESEEVPYSVMAESPAVEPKIESRSKPSDQAVSPSSLEALQENHNNIPSQTCHSSNTEVVTDAVCTNLTDKDRQDANRSRAGRRYVPPHYAYRSKKLIQLVSGARPKLRLPILLAPQTRHSAQIASKDHVRTFGARCQS
jgi:hypothetical protein